MRKGPSGGVSSSMGSAAKSDLALGTPIEMGQIDGGTGTESLIVARGKDVPRRRLDFPIISRGWAAGPGRRNSAGAQRGA